MSMTPPPGNGPRCDPAATTDSLGLAPPPTQQPMEKTKTKSNDSHPILVDDALFFVQVEPLTARPGGPRRSAAMTGGQPIADVFRKTFTDVWAQIPGDDRWQLLNYWDVPQDFTMFHIFSSLKVRPLLRVVECGPWSPSHIAITQLGFVLTFPHSLVIEHAQQLPREIARALAGTFRLATREYWQLIIKEFDDPIAAWEQKLGDKVTEEAREKKLDALEATYLRKLWAHVDQIVHRWEFGSPPRDRDRGQRQSPKSRCRRGGSGKA